MCGVQSYGCKNVNFLNRITYSQQKQQSFNDTYTTNVMFAFIHITLITDSYLNHSNTAYEYLYQPTDQFKVNEDQQQISNRSANKSQFSSHCFCWTVRPWAQVDIYTTWKVQTLATHLKRKPWRHAHVKIQTSSRHVALTRVLHDQMPR